MATIAEQLTSLANTKTAIKDAIVAKGVAVADTDPFSAYAGKIGQISGGGGAPATKYGVSIDNLIGDISESGGYRVSKEFFTIDLSELKEFTPDAFSTDDGILYPKGLAYKFYGNVALSGTVDLSNLEKCASSYHGLDGAFAYSGVQEIILPAFKTGTQIYISEPLCEYCYRLKKVVLNSDRYTTNYYIAKAFTDCVNLVEVVGFEKAKTVEQFSNVFERCSSLPTIDVGGIETIGNQAMTSTFADCKALSGVLYFTNLQSIGYRGLATTFKNDTLLTAAYFPSLTAADSQAFGRNAANATFVGCAGITELHFRADAQAIIEAQVSYSGKLGATNATIYYDL